jgi:hypothetical protein
MIERGIAADILYTGKKTDFSETNLNVEILKFFSIVYLVFAH